MASPAWLKRIEQRIRRISARALALCFRPITSPPPPDRLAVRKVCIMRIEEKVGDLLTTVPLMRSARHTFPEAKVTALVAARLVKLIQGIPEVDEVIAFDKRSVLSPRKFAAQVRALRKSTFDLVIDGSSWTALSVTTVMVMKLFLRYQAAIGHPADLADRFFDYRPAIVDDPNEIRRCLGLLGAVPGARLIEDLALPQRPVPAETDEVLDSAQLLGKPFVLLHPGAYRAARQWRLSDQSVFCHRLAAHFEIPVLVVYGPHEVSQKSAIMRHFGAFPLVGTAQNGLDTLIGLMRRATLVVTMNSGPMHLAVGSGTPTLSLFLNSSAERWGYLSGPHLMLDLDRIGTDPDKVLCAARSWIDASLSK